MNESRLKDSILSSMLLSNVWMDVGELHKGRHIKIDMWKSCK
jgi:hypothetical protein